MTTSAIHQTLHGYSDGHRLIAGSLSLSSADARIMVVMSDLSGSGVKPDQTGYLTGYPLEVTGKYVLARTWAAPEMPRPGCVWTHSLLIDYSDLARMTSAVGLLRAFRRPAGTLIRSEYSSPADIELFSGFEPVPSMGRGRKFLAALYAAPEKTVVAEVGSPSEDELLVTEIWLQQWPRLRRAFGFCTLAGVDRSGKGVALDLQLVRDADRQARSKFPNSVTPDDVHVEPALRPLVDDLVGVGGGEIRDFLRRVGGDVDGGRKAMVPLCRLYSALFSGGRHDLGSAVAAVGALDVLGTRQARSVRNLIAHTAINEVDSINDDVFDFVMDTLEAEPRPNEKPIGLESVGAALWRRSPSRFLEAVDAGGRLGQASLRALADISAPDLVRGLRAAPDFAPRITNYRPDLLRRADFWGISELKDELALVSDAQDAEAVAEALIEAGRPGPYGFVVEWADPIRLAKALDVSLPETLLHAWLKALAGNPNKAAAVLASGQVSSRRVVNGLARVSDPDTVPNDYGEDPWLIALNASRGRMDQADEDFLAAYVMSRGLGQRSRSPAELMRFAYTTLYRALQHDRLIGPAQILAVSRLSWGGWFTWDNCARLRETVVDRFVDRQLDPEIFGRLSDDGGLATSLIDEAARTGRGRRYLEKVRKKLKEAGEKPIRARADYIASKIK